MFFRYLTDLLFPRRCPACHGITDKKGELICEKCVGRFSAVKAPFCFKCGKEIGDEREEYCGDCIKKSFPFSRNVAAFNYDEIAGNSVMRFKNGGRREYADYYAQQLLSLRGKEIAGFKPDAIIPVPLLPAKKRERGFNQAEEIARRIEKAIGVRLLSDAVIKVKNTGSQKQLDAKSRQESLKNAFLAKYSLKDFPRVLLVDDVFTTGSTLSALAKTVKKAGAKEVFGATVFVGKEE